jgi:citronellol/citronellal dehydrogenase
MATLQGKTIFISGGSRGIGREIALKAAQDGANIVIAAKTSEPHPTLSGTIYSVAKEIEERGGKVLPLQVDIRFKDQVMMAAQKAADTFGGIDILVNNASAISLTGTLHTEMKKFDLMFNVNVRGTFVCSKVCIPYLKKADNPHILTLSPPLNMRAHWFKDHCAYTMSKYGMSMCVLGMAEEFKDAGIAVNALWPKTTIATAAINMLGGETYVKASRSPQIVADAAYIILNKKSKECTGSFFVDEDLLREHGVQDFSIYSKGEDLPLIPDFFLD